ncbi:MAG: ferritin-like domain-containing protein [Magnetospirillum sp.]|nr:ferritin-like domain-containing protein [Magnetospirillum sp.]
MARWTAADIPWVAFEPARLDADLLKLVKAASVVERNAADYTAYLRAVFRGEPTFLAIADGWQADEERHGDVLGRYAEMADPGFDFPSRFRRFVDGYRIPLDRATSVRGSLTGEMLARCIVETGTSSLYSALGDATEEPLLKAICRRIAADEFRHYKMFYEVMRALAQRERVPVFRRLAVAVGRVREADDDELSYAWYAANEAEGVPYERRSCARAYARRAFGCYRDKHAERAVSMIMKAVGLAPHGWLAANAKRFAKWKMAALAAA